MGGKFFTPDDIWLGGSYQLAIEVTAHKDDDRLFEVLKALWSYPQLDGVYRRGDVEPSEQEKFDPHRKNIERFYFAYGIATLSDGKHLACSTWSVRETNGSDWLVLDFPMGALGKIYDVGYPLFWHEKICCGLNRLKHGLLN